jgi:hypothetical protein
MTTFCIAFYDSYLSAQQTMTENLSNGFSSENPCGILHYSYRGTQIYVLHELHAEVGTLRDVQMF